ncbi:MAG: response regulator transcription factor [Deltaproteobacteria bacterium]|nr:response regulator transcription factor [Deltaproteobacteria bacterium]
MPTRIFIADDHEIVRDGLKVLLDQTGDLKVVGEASNGAETLARLSRTPADVLVLDLSMPGGMSGARVAEEVIKAHPRTSIVVLTMHDDDHYLRELLEIGVYGYILKQSATTNLVNAVRSAARGEHYVDPSMTSHMVSAFIGKPVRERPARVDLLSGREREVCTLLALGHTNAEVGKQLHISERTVEVHRRKIMDRLSLRNRAALVKFAMDNGLLKNPQ